MHPFIWDLNFSFVNLESKVHTNATILIQIDVQDSLQTMLEGSYKSGTCKVRLHNRCELSAKLPNFLTLENGVTEKE